MEFSLDEKLKLAKEMCDSNYANTHKFSYVYPFTTENITAYLSLFDLNDKSLFTIGSSCDQAINAILAGSKNIMIFDICPFVKEYYYLKKAAIECLTLEQFLRFFCYKNYPVTFMDNKDAFDMALYQKLKDVLKNSSEESEYFWSEVFNKYNGSVVRYRVFSTDENKHKIIRYVNPYLKDNENYFSLRKKINDANVRFTQGDIFNDQITGNYDNIILSNLSSYYSLSKIKELFDKMLNNLNENGRMMIAYLYETDQYSEDYMEGEAEIYNIPKVLEILPKDINFDTFVGVRGLLFKSSRLRDSVITYRKVKKI